jgi:hypothetical protein
MSKEKRITKGYWFNKKDNKWVSCIGIRGKNKDIGYFDNEEDASLAYSKEKERLHSFSLQETYKEYVDIPGYDGMYRISKDGDIISLKRSTIQKRKIQTNKNGYSYIVLTANGIPKVEFIHRLLYRTFVGEIPENLVIDHIDRNQKNNSIDNLRLVTMSVNSQNISRVINAKGASYDKRKKVWYSAISVNGNRIYLGTFNTEENAINAYKIAKLKYHSIGPDLPE